MKAIYKKLFDAVLIVIFSQNVNPVTNANGYDLWGFLNVSFAHGLHFVEFNVEVSWFSL